MAALDAFIPDDSPQRTLFSITTGLAADLGPYSAFPGEGELLIPAGHVFEVVNVKRFSRSARRPCFSMPRTAGRPGSIPAWPAGVRAACVARQRAALTGSLPAATSPSWSSRPWPTSSACPSDHLAAARTGRGPAAPASDEKRWLLLLRVGQPAPVRRRLSHSTLWRTAGRSCAAPCAAPAPLLRRSLRRWPDGAGRGGLAQAQSPEPSLRCVWSGWAAGSVG
jgi:hypothetical protein